jgi:alkylation response protein AidB-like acyl-CoA dehydrogenase
MTHTITDATEAVEAVREATRGLTAQYDRAYWVKCIDESRQPVEYLKALGDGGLLALGVPDDLGGAGGGLREQIALLEELGRAGIPGSSFLIANFVRHTLIRHGSAEQVAKYVPPTLTGETFTSFCLTEADAGTNAFAMMTRADRDRDGWVINGQKCFITGFGEASQAMIVAKTSAPEDRRAELSLFMVDLPHPGITFARQRMSVAAPDNQYHVFFDDVRLPSNALVGNAGEGTSYLFNALNSERLLASGMLIGLGEFALQKGVAYAKTRAPFGEPLGSYQAVAHPLARAKVQLEAAAALLAKTLDDLDQPGAETTYGASACKLLASEAANLALDATIQVHGGWAFDLDLDVSTLLETLRLFRIVPINTESALSLVATSALGLPRNH